jgi:radical SAM superfamily enzyme YgiQ (UPF0313 family)
MTKKILLTCPPVRFDVEKMSLRFPFGTLCLGSYLKEKGALVWIYHDQPYTQRGFLKTLKDIQPAIVGFSCDSANFSTCAALSRLVKKFNKDICVVMGGIHASCFDRLILEKTPTVDIVVRHEGEETLHAILACIPIRNDGRGLDKVAGISYRTNNGIVTNKDRPLIMDIDALPPLAYELIDMNRVESYNFPGWWPIHSGRGCCYACKFCASVGQWKRVHRAMSPGRVIDEIDRCRERYHIRGCYFYDLTFTIDKNRARQICRAMKERNVPWGCYTNPSCCNPALLEDMHDSGCRRVIFGVESLSDRMLKLMGKPHRSRQAVDILNKSHATGMETRFEIMLGFPGETEATLKENLDGLKQLDKGIMQNNIYLYQLHPGSPMYTTMKQLGMIDDEAWFKGFRMEDFIQLYYPQAFIKKIIRAKQDIEAMFQDVYEPPKPL